MGEQADYLMEQEFDRWLEREETAACLLAAEVWRCADGTDIEVAQMGTSHIINARNRMGQCHQSPTIQAWIRIFNKELKRRGAL